MRSGSLTRSGFDAIVLAGGSGRRMGGIDKATIDIGGVSLLELTLAAASGADTIICVGPERDTSRPVLWTREDPPGTGPVAAVAAGMELVEAPVVAVLSVDTPFVTAAVVRDLVTVSADEEAAMISDDEGVPQPLIAAYASFALRSRLGSIGDPTGASMRSLIEGISYSVLQEPSVAFDCDTWEDVETVRRAEGFG